jgi:hypothetical protein
MKTAALKDMRTKLSASGFFILALTALAAFSINIVVPESNPEALKKTLIIHGISLFLAIAGWKHDRKTLKAKGYSYGTDRSRNRRPD